MSGGTGLLPRNSAITESSGVFSDLQVNTLSVLQSAVINSMTVNNQVINTITTNTVNGNPGITITATAPVTINGDEVVVENSSPTFAKITTPLLNNGADINVPTSAGTLALVGDLSSYVTLGTPQTITGIKTFSASPVVSQITNTGTLTLPTSTDTLTGRNTTDTLTNKTINSIDNTVQVDGTDINDLIDQSVKQTADVSFQTVSSVGSTTSGGNLTSQGTLIVTGPKISPLPTTSQLTAGLDTLGNPRLQFWGDPANPIGSLTFGNLAGTSQYEGKIDYDGPTDTFGFYTAGSATPIVNITPTTATISGSEVATTSNSLVFSNKTIDSSANTIQISNSPLSAANINTLINQPVLTSSGVVFSNITATQTNPFVSVTDLSRNGLLGISSVANAWFSGAATGDFCISNRTNGAIRLGQGTGAQPANFILTTSSCSIVQPTTVPRLTQSGYSAVCRYNLTANALVTNVVVTGVFVNIVTSIALASIPLQNFNTNGNVGVTYTGSLSRRFLISYSVTITTSANIGHSLQCTINGVSVPASVKSGHSHIGATAPSTTSCSWISLLAPNDQLQLQLANLTNTTDLLAERITFTLNELDF